MSEAKSSKPEYTLGDAICMVCKYCTLFTCCTCPVTDIRRYQYDRLDDGPFDR